MTPTTASSESDHAQAARLKVSALTALSLVVTVALLAWVGDAEPIIDLSLWMVPLVILGFVATGPLVFNLELKAESTTFTPTDIPLAIGLLTLSPVLLVAARIIGTSILLVGTLRQPLMKLNLNLSSVALECMVASLVLRLFISQNSAASLQTWGWLALSLLAGLICGGVTIAGAISFFEGGFAQHIAKSIRHVNLFYLPGVVLGSCAAIPLFVEPALVIIFMLPAPIVWMALRSHGMLMVRYSDLSGVFEFSSQVGRSTQVQEVADTAVAEIADQLRAGSVALRVWADGGGTVESACGDADLLAVLPERPADTAPEAPLSAETVEVNGDADGTALQRGLISLDIRSALVVPLIADGRPIGTVVVADRLGASTQFNKDDRSRMQKIQEQLAVALRKAQLHDQVQHDAMHDRLTALPNRPHFELWLDHTLSEAGEESAVMLLDLDRFKEVNDTLGHDAGDDLLRLAAMRIRGVLAERDFLARFGGDEFAILIPGAGQHEAVLLAERISQVLEKPFTISDSTVALSASIGIVLTPLHGDECATLLRRADLAMYEAKRRHHQSALYHPTLDGSDSARLAMLADLRASFDDGTLSVVFQPKIDLRTDTVAAVEALCRWTHEKHGAVSPEVFIPIAEQAGMIEELTEFVLEQSLTAAARWGAEGRTIGVAVNLSPLSLVNEGLPRLVARRLEQADIRPNILTLEITEQSAIIDTPRAARILEQLAGIGVRISVDDFGTGHSSLTNLRKLPITELKIDRSFVGEMLVEHNDDVIVKSTIDLGHNLGLSVVAEGVETEDARERLRSLGCDMAQGYGICRPLSVEKLDRWLETAQVARDNRRSTR